MNKITSNLKLNKKLLIVATLALSSFNCAFAQSQGQGQGSGQWKTTGNATSGSEFIGTTGPTDLTFKTNSLERARLTKDGLLTIGTQGNTTENLHVFGSGMLTDNLHIGKNLEVLERINAGEMIVGKITPGDIMLELATRLKGEMRLLGSGFIKDYLNVGGDPNTEGPPTDPEERLHVNGKGVFKNDISVSGNITASGNVSANKLTSATSLEFGGGNSLSSSTIGNVKVLRLGSGISSPNDVLNTFCNDPNTSSVYTVTQLETRLQLYGNNDEGKLNVLTLGFDGANGFLDMAGQHTGGGPALLINYHCGKNVAIGGASGDLYVNNNLYARKNQEIIGNLGVGVVNPNQRIQAAGMLQSVNANHSIGIVSDGAHGIIESTQDILINLYSGKDVIAAGNMLSKGFNIEANKNTWTSGWGVSLTTPIGSAWQTRSTANNGKYLGFGITSSGWYYIAADALNGGSVCYPMHYEISGSEPNGYRLSVQGTIYTNKVNVVTTTWCDYVFEKDYTLLSISELDEFLQKEKHLPGIPSAKEVVSKGIDLGEMQKMQMEKIEELSLYVIELKKENEKLIERMNKIEK